MDIYIKIAAISAICNLVHPYQASETHRCQRPCDSRPMVCEYEFNIEWYLTMNSACFLCPDKRDDCFKHDCIPADGFGRAAQVVNRRLPGPLIEVCHGDEVKVNVKNKFSDTTTTIHWHGQHQRGTPFMDGVPYVTQCPIQPGASFLYRFRATEPGTMFWHSHSGSQRNNGLYGAMIIRREKEPHANLYDFDLVEHIMFISDWSAQVGETDMLTSYQNQTRVFPRSILINGLGKYNDFKHATTDIPTSRFVVKQGSRYRLRIIGGTSMDIPVIISIDNHRFSVISADGIDIEPIATDALTVGSGERFDIVLEANEVQGLYWIRYHGLIEGKDNQVYQGAVLQYEGQSDIEYPLQTLTYENTNRIGKHVNAITMSSNNVHAADFKPLSKEKLPWLIDYVDYKFYLSYNMQKFRDPRFQLSKPNNSTDILAPIILPLFNNIAGTVPPFPLLSQRDDAESTTFCNKTAKLFEECIFVLEVKLGSVVEIVFIDEGTFYNISHSMHIHGNYFHILGQNSFGHSTNESYVKELDTRGELPRNLVNPPMKDTVAVPDGGYVIVRFMADNPGYWLLHCHIERHMKVGMNLIIKIGEHDEMPPVPKNFPTCGNYVDVPEPPKLNL